MELNNMLSLTFPFSSFASYQSHTFIYQENYTTYFPSVNKKQFSFHPFGTENCFKIYLFLFLLSLQLLRKIRHCLGNLKPLGTDCLTASAAYTGTWPLLLWLTQ